MEKQKGPKYYMLITTKRDLASKYLALKNVMRNLFSTIMVFDKKESNHSHFALT